VTSSNPTLISASKPKLEDKFKIEEEEEEYDENDDGLDEDDDEDYYTQPENVKASKIPTTTDVPLERETTIRGGRNEDTTIKIFTQKSATQKQVAAIINPDKNVRLVQTQNGRTVKYPPTFDSKVDKKNRQEDVLKRNNVNDDSDSDDGNSEDIIISKTTQKIKYKTRYLPSKPSDSDPKNSVVDNNKKAAKPDSYVSVTNSLSGNISDDSKFDSTYITKSSSCGHSTFSCNIVYSSEGKRTQVCKPRKPNPKC
jgi:hypothetical protein